MIKLVAVTIGVAGTITRVCWAPDVLAFSTLELLLKSKFEYIRPQHTTESSSTSGLEFTSLFSAVGFLTR